MIAAVLATNLVVQVASALNHCDNQSLAIENVQLNMRTYSSERASHPPVAGFLYILQQQALHYDTAAKDDASGEDCSSWPSHNSAASTSQRCCHMPSVT